MIDLNNFTDEDLANLSDQDLIYLPDQLRMLEMVQRSGVRRRAQRRSD